jgi:hypothetical protein
MAGTMGGYIYDWIYTNAGVYDSLKASRRGINTRELKTQNSKL